MSEEGDENKRGSKDNTGRDLKPDQAQNNDNAPTGSLGTNSIKGPSLGLGGTSKKTQATEAGEKTQQSESAQKAEDNRPIAVETGVEEIDKQSEENGQQVMSMDDIKAKAHGEDASQKSEGPQVSQSDYAKAFRQAVGEQERQKQQQQSKGFDLE